MCGICGIIQQEDAPVDQDTLVRMNEAIHHRGPDSDGYYIDHNAALAMRRLAIIDLISGDQPISKENKTIWVVMNGEIYNFPEIRRDLEGRGHTFRTNSDTELLVHLYEEYGSGFASHLRGMFAFALWDGNRHLVVDRARPPREETLILLPILGKIHLQLGDSQRPFRTSHNNRKYCRRRSMII